MAQPPSLLPSEVWSHVFGHLSVRDKISVRASCRYFKNLIDHRSLWKGWSVALHFPNGQHSYNRPFWASLRCRKVTSVVMSSTKEQDWRQLAMALPALTTIVMVQSSQSSLDCLDGFPRLKRLAIRNSWTALRLSSSTLEQPRELTHLHMCNVKFRGTDMSSFISSISHFTNLSSLVCHQMGVLGETTWLLQCILTCLPKLRHLSLSVEHRLYYLHSLPRGIPGPLEEGAQEEAAPALSSLELINYMEPSLPDDAMRMMPGLKSLAVFYRHSHHEVLELPPPECHLKTWLSDLPQLSTLVVVKGPHVRKYVTSIPATVTSLTLCVAGLSSEDLAAVAVQVPQLQHLHIDAWPSHLGAHTAQIPHLFPKLKSLKLRHEHVPEKDFLHLHKLQDLERLEVLDNLPQLSELTRKLQALTNYRLQVTTFPRQRDVLSCPCVSQVY